MQTTLPIALLRFQSRIMSKRISSDWLCLITVIFSLVSISAHSKEIEKIKLNISGSSTIAPLASELAKAFELKYPNYLIFK